VLIKDKCQYASLIVNLCQVKFHIKLDSMIAYKSFNVSAIKEKDKNMWQLLKKENFLYSNKNYQKKYFKMYSFPL